jgi:hypothetical protein
MIGIWNIGHRMCVCVRREGEGNEVAVPNYVGLREAYEGIGKSRALGCGWYLSLFAVSWKLYDGNNQLK